MRVRWLGGFQIVHMVAGAFDPLEYMSGRWPLVRVPVLGAECKNAPELVGSGAFG